MNSPATASDSPWVIFITVEIKLEYVDEFLELVQGVIDQMRQEASFVSTVLSTDRSDPTKYSLFEIWKDREEFFAVQLQRSYRQRYIERIGLISKSPRQISEWTQLRADYKLGAGPPTNSYS